MVMDVGGRGMAEMEASSAIQKSSDGETGPRLWPALVIVALQWAGRFGLPAMMSEANLVGLILGLVGGLAIMVWWGFFSGAQLGDRWLALVATVVALLATPLVLHDSVATGMQGLMLVAYAAPVMSLAFVTWACLARKLPDGARRVSMVAVLLLSCGAWGLVRTGGFSGYMVHDFAWRWSLTAEERLLAGLEEGGDFPDSVPELVALEDEESFSWPGFRGSGRNSRVEGARIARDWSLAPPVEIWRRPIGPGWSSFAVHGSLLYTQEQRGDEELTSCYEITTGRPIWDHRDKTRFWESNGGAGPRGTPTYDRERLYSLGATGILNVLDASDGSLVWSRNAATDTQTQTPEWGFSGSPLVAGELVIVAVAGTLAAYDRDSGELRWTGSGGGGGYSSPKAVSLDGVDQVLLVSGDGLTSVLPMSGAPLWNYGWSGQAVVQPELTEDGQLLVSVGSRGELRSLRVARSSEDWSVEELWSSTRLKPSFNDFVVQGSHAYGLDSGILTCVELTRGRREWKGGRYGHGQLILLSEQQLLLILTEQGEVVLVEAVPDDFNELGRIQAIETKTWNHPVLVNDILLVRNAEEMAAFRLSPPLQ